MNRYRNDASSEIVLIGLVIVLVGMWIVVKLVQFVLRTMIENYKNKTLWLSLTVCVILCAIGILLLSVRLSPAFVVLPIVGLVQYLIVCLVVSLRGRQTLLAEKSPGLVHSILRSSWWSDNDVPLQNEHTELLAA